MKRILILSIVLICGALGYSSALQPVCGIDGKTYQNPTVGIPASYHGECYAHNVTLSEEQKKTYKERLEIIMKPYITDNKVSGEGAEFAARLGSGVALLTKAQLEQMNTLDQEKNRTTLVTRLAILEYIGDRLVHVYLDPDNIS